MAKDVIGGVTNTTLHFEDGKLIVEESQDAEPILNYAHAARNHRFDADAAGGLLRHEAEIPMVVYIHECRKRGVQMFSREAEGVIEAILADPQYAYLRAAPKVIDPRVKVKGLR